jgi:hypothetical protein
LIPLSLRLKCIKCLIVLAYIAGFLFSPLLWRNEGRFFSIIKPIEAIPALPAPFDLLLIILFVSLSVLWLFIPKRIFGFAAVACLIIVLVQDQMRWQPWVYIYLLLMMPYLFQSDRDEKSILNYLQLIIPGIYIWSGLHKFGPNFIEGPFAQMITDSKYSVDFSAIKKLGYFVPLIETSMGVMLLLPKYRKVGVCLVVATHLLLLFYLSQWATIKNSVVYPWNMAMIFFVVLVYWGVQDKPVLSFGVLKSHPARAIPLLLVWVLPVLNFAGCWDHYLSFSLYSNKPHQYYIVIKNKQLDKIDKGLHQYLTKVDGLDDSKVLDLNHWTLTELNVPFYPERRLFEKVRQRFCSLELPEDDLFYVDMSFVEGQQHIDKLSCK